MAYIKKMVMHGFKSFANKTEIEFDKGINVIIGPNGSGKSNISDALCFVLGRLSMKSIRAARAKSLLFMGSKYAKPAREAMVEMIFDNTDRAFGIDSDEIRLTRTVRHNGLSVYKINNEAKTRADIVEMLAQAGLDPQGFNLILQGQIQTVVGMHPEERRKVVEEVAGISRYEASKEKSLHELEKSEEKLKEINAVLRERTSFLKNLENERQQAMRFKELEITVRRCKASMLAKKIEGKKDEVDSIIKSIEEKSSQRSKLREKAEEVQKYMDALSGQIMGINKHIQNATGVERETLQAQVADLKAEIEGLRVRKENHENRRAEIERRIDANNKTIPSYEEDIAELKNKSPLVAKKQEEINRKKKELAQIEDDRKKLYALKTELNAVGDRIRDKESQRARMSGESDALIKQMEESVRSLHHADEKACKKALELSAGELSTLRARLKEVAFGEIEYSKQFSSAETEMRGAEQIKVQVGQIDTCPLCQSAITPEHIKHVSEKEDEIIKRTREICRKSEDLIKRAREEQEALTKESEHVEKIMREHEKELSRHFAIAEKNERLKHFMGEDKRLSEEIKNLSEKRDALQKKNADAGRLEDEYITVLHEIEEISSRNEDNLDQTISFKERDLETVRKKIKADIDEIKQTEKDIGNFEYSLKAKTKMLEQKSKEEEALAERFKKLFQERDSMQETIQAQSFELSELQGDARQIEEQINFLKIGHAKTDAERDSMQMELGEYSGIEIIKASMSALEERMQKAQASLQVIGSINLRALEIYDQMKQEYDRIQDRVNTLLKEKEEILKIIGEIDHKKKRTFMRTFNQLNEKFSTNFSKLSAKGQAFLELDNQEDIFAGGVNIVIRMGKGKYFDVTSLSGGEKTLVALSLLFAIQEHKPYHFYIFDEIDAALDKRNSERLSALLKQYMRSGQYITITHNDALIMDATVLYGVSMHEGISKILSLKVGEEVSSKVAEILNENKGAQEFPSSIAVESSQQISDAVRDENQVI